MTIVSLRCASQTEFVQKCTQLNTLLENQNNYLVVKNGQVSAMTKPRGLYWLISLIYKRKECRFHYISEKVVEFLEKNIEERGFIYEGPLITQLEDRWKQKSIAPRLMALHRVIRWHHKYREIRHSSSLALKKTEEANKHLIQLQSKATQIEKEMEERILKTQKRCDQLLKNAHHAASTVLQTQQMQEPLWDLRTDEETKDAVIQCKDGELKAHSLILKKSKLIDLKEFSTDDIEPLLDYLYTQKLPSTSIRQLLILYKLADVLSYEELKTSCMNFLAQTFGIDIRLSFSALMDNLELACQFKELNEYLLLKVGEALFQNLLSSEEATLLFTTIRQLHEKNPSPEYAGLLGLATLKGIGTEKDETAALQFFINCQDTCIGQFGLGYMYHHGLGSIPQNEGFAEKYYAASSHYLPSEHYKIIFGLEHGAIFLNLLADIIDRGVTIAYAETQWVMYSHFPQQVDFLKKAAAQGLECAVQKLKELENEDEKKNN